MNEATRLGLVSFHATSAADVIEKLRRELQRIEQASDLETAKDHVTNAFWSAWHVHKWMWDAIDEKPDLKQTVLEYRGIACCEIDDEVAFGAMLASRFMPLKICRLIATSSRYVDVTSGLSSNLSSSTPSSLNLVVLGRPISATRLLTEIDNYWVTMILDCGIEG